MIDALKSLLKQPYWVVALVAGVLLIGFPCITVDKDYHFLPHPPPTVIPIAIGVALLLLSSIAFAFTLIPKRASSPDDSGAGLDMSRVREDKDGALWTMIGGCHLRVVAGRLEEQQLARGCAVVLPCNEYFDDECAADANSALGAYVNRAFDGRAEEFLSLMKQECRKQLGEGLRQQKTTTCWSESFGVGKCLLLVSPLKQSTPVALISTTTQRAGKGLSSKISDLFVGMHELVARLADARLNEVVMPILGAGHGSIYPPQALVSLLLAIDEVVRYAGGQFLKRATIVIFQRHADSQPEVARVVVRRGLALIGSRQ